MSTMFEKGDVMQYKKVSAREKYCFGIGAIGKDAICNMVGVFLMVYFTDTLYLAPAFVGVLFFVARIWDAVNDPMMGMIVDNTHTKYGKFRIWLVIGTVVNAVVFVLLFCSFHLHGTALYTYVSVMYILYGMTYTIMDVPYWSWLPNLTNDPHEREKVSVIPRFFASLAGFCVATFGLYVITGLNKMSGKEQYAETGYTLFAVIIAVVFLITIGITVFNVKEESTVGAKGRKTSLKEAFQVIIQNDQLLAFIGLLLAFNLCIRNGSYCRDDWVGLFPENCEKDQQRKSIYSGMSASGYWIRAAWYSGLYSTAECSGCCCQLCIHFFWFRTFSGSYNLLYRRCY